MSCTFDTNILVYTLGQPADVKRQRAQSLIIRGARRQTAVLLLQSLAEFSYVATRKFGVSVASARRRVNGWRGGFRCKPPRSLIWLRRSISSARTTSPSGMRGCALLRSGWA
jgi:predicted nucleic acid-binding protein